MIFGFPKTAPVFRPPTGPASSPVRVWVGRVLVLCLVVPAGCSSRGPAPARDTPLVVATTTIVADLVRQVAGDRVTIDCLMGDGIDPHSYKATPRDADRLRAADLIVASGLHLEGKLADLLEKLSARVPVVAVADGLPRDLLLDAGGGLHDPHVWFDARLWSRCVPVVEEALVRIDPAGGPEYRRRAEAHRHDLEAADDAVRRTIAGIPPSQRVLVTAHDAFRYFGRAYGLEVVGVQGTSTESEAGLNDINRLVSLLVERGIPAVFVETSVSDRNVAALVEGAAVGGHAVAIGGRLYSDSLGAAGSGAETLVGTLEANARTIAAALAGPPAAPPVAPPAAPGTRRHGP